MCSSDLELYLKYYLIYEKKYKKNPEEATKLMMVDYAEKLAELTAFQSVLSQIEKKKIKDDVLPFLHTEKQKIALERQQEALREQVRSALREAERHVGEKAESNTDALSLAIQRLENCIKDVPEGMVALNEEVAIMHLALMQLYQKRNWDAASTDSGDKRLALEHYYQIDPSRLVFEVAEQAIKRTLADFALAQKDWESYDRFSG